ncbi:MAG: hypothetical protein H2174_03700 [Vampirovibrio sp.]|nr:hypothetical protein [Vampirovibrio sp.]
MDLGLLNRFRTFNSQVGNLNPKNGKDKKKLAKIEREELPKLLQAVKSKAPLAAEFLKTYFNEKNAGLVTFDFKKSGLWENEYTRQSLKNLDAYFGFKYSDNGDMIPGASRKQSTVGKIREKLKNKPANTTINITDPWETQAGYDDPNFRHALGKATLKGMFTGTAKKLPNGKIHITGKIEYQVQDSYDWDRHYTHIKTPLTNFTIKVYDSNMKKFATAGLAKEFDVKSTTVTETVNVTMNASGP